jgi:hypothetical protein
LELGGGGTTITFPRAAGTRARDEDQAGQHQKGKVKGFVFHIKLFGLKRLNLPLIMQI